MRYCCAVDEGKEDSDRGVLAAGEGREERSEGEGGYFLFQGEEEFNGDVLD